MAVRPRPAVLTPPVVLSSLTAAEKKARRETLRALMFNKKESEFLARIPGDLNGSAFQIGNSNDCQLYVHEHIAQCNVDKVNNSEVMIGPSKSSVFLRDCDNCTFVVFC